MAAFLRATSCLSVFIAGKCVCASGVPWPLRLKGTKDYEGVEEVVNSVPMLDPLNLRLRF